MEELLKPATRIDEDVGDTPDDIDYIVDEEEYDNRYIISEAGRLLYLVETRYGA